MAAGSITTLPALPDDGGGSGAFPPGHFKDPKRLYCKNGGFFLRINPDGRVDGVRENSDPHTLLLLARQKNYVTTFSRGLIPLSEHHVFPLDFVNIIVFIHCQPPQILLV
ncbi:UNVERIFIED_CONTAM: Fibroblast growth factor 2 [Gekko kuhli]